MTDKKSKPPFYLIDTDSEFYRPFGRRLAICIAVAVWALIELYAGNGFWIVISGSAAIYCAYVLFYTYKPPEPPMPAPATDSEGDSDGDDAPAEGSPAPKDGTPPAS